MSDDRYVFRNGKIIKAVGEELQQILERENRTQEEQETEYVSLNGLRLLEELKVERDILLLQSDWTQGADSPLSDDKKTEWANYRQELRDFPSTFLDDDGNVTVNILAERVWPTKPS